MSLHQTYADAKAKAKEKPWYTRWVWWLVAAGLFLLVLGLWYLAKRDEANTKAAARVADEKATKAELEAKSEKDAARAAELRREAEDARTKARELAVKVNESAARRREVEAAIKGASSWDELDEIEDGLE